MHTFGQAIAESAAVLLVGLAIIGSLMFVFSRNTDLYSTTSGASYAQVN